MKQSDLQGDTASCDAQTRFAGRDLSETWDRIPLVDGSQNYVWMWFKHPNVPQGLIVNIPDETYRSYPHLDEQLTMRKLLQAAGVDPGCVSMWQLNGVAYDGMNGTTPLLDAAIPGPVTGVDPNIVVCIDVPHVDTMQHVTEDVEEGSLSEVFDRVETDWNASLDTEKELTRTEEEAFGYVGQAQFSQQGLVISGTFAFK